MSRQARQASCHLALSLSGDRDVTQLHGPEDSVDLSGHVTLQAADDLALGLALCRASSHVVLRRLVPAQADHDDVIEGAIGPVSYTHLRAHETDSYLVCRLLL